MVLTSERFATLYWYLSQLVYSDQIHPSNHSTQHSNVLPVMVMELWLLSMPLLLPEVCDNRQSRVYEVTIASKHYLIPAHLSNTV